MILPHFSSPSTLFLIIPAAIILIIVITRQFILPQSKEDKENFERTRAQRKRSRLLIGVSRFIIMLLLISALADPFLVQQVTKPGDQTIKILDDKSKSFTLFEEGLGEKIDKTLAEYIPTELIPVGDVNKSDIADTILTNLNGNDNILLVSDGNNNEGKSLEDLILFASSINSTIYALDIAPIKDDARVVIEGPDKTVSGVINSFVVDVTATDGKPRQVEVKANADVLFSGELLGQRVFKKSFSQGDQQLTATIISQDTFPENNRFIKSVHVVKKPKVLFVTSKPSAFEPVLRELYDLIISPVIPENIEQFYTIILNDITTVQEPDVDRLSEFISNGNGVVVWGGQNSFDRSTYKNSYFETILPVKVGTGEVKDSDVNIVILVDISGSTGIKLESGNKFVDVAKAQAVNIMKDLDPQDNVGVLAFNIKPFMVRPIGPVRVDMADTIEKVYSLQNGGGTVIAPAIAQATQMLASTKGSKNIVLISDGKTAGVDQALAQIEFAASIGINTYTVGFGEGTRIENMQAFAVKGNGAFFQPGETSRLRVAFGNPSKDSPESTGFELFNSNPNHFITQSVEFANASITGYNQVIPKSASQVIVSTTQNNPLITVWRFGLGRVATITTDDGSRWAGNLLSPARSKLFIRTINWATGSLNRKDDYFVEAQDTYVGETLDITVKSPTKPQSDFLTFSKSDENMYEATFVPQQIGFLKILDRTIAVNYPEEYKETGMNPKLEELVFLTGGKLFKPEDVQDMIQNIKLNAQRIETNKVHYAWLAILIALCLFFTEVAIRRLIENKRLSQGE